MAIILVPAGYGIVVDGIFVITGAVELIDIIVHIKGHASTPPIDGKLLPQPPGHAARSFVIVA